MAYLLLLLTVPAFLWGLQILIRRYLLAPRVVEDQEPVGLPWQEVSIPSVGHKRLFAWWIPQPRPAPVVILLHGWGGNAQMMLPLAPSLHLAGSSLLLLDARCHGQSDDDNFASLPRFAEDLEAALDWLRAGPGGDSPVSLIGHSVGAGAALLTASRRSDVAAVVSLAAFAHPRTMMQRWLGEKGFPPWLIRGLLAYVEYTIGYRFDVIAPCHTISLVRCPVLLIHGQSDTTVPVTDAEAIIANAPTGLVRLTVVPGSHGETEAFTGVMGEVEAFLQPNRSSPTAS